MASFPISLMGVSVEVLINNIPGNIYYASASQVNVLIPTILIAGPATVQLVNNGLAGPLAMIMLATAAPVLFQADAINVVATHGNGPLVTPDQPAQANEVVVLYATGLGPTSPAAIPNQIPQTAAWITDRADFRVVLNGTDVGSGLILHAGVTPG